MLYLLYNEDPICLSNNQQERVFPIRYALAEFVMANIYHAAPTHVSVILTPQHIVPDTSFHSFSLPPSSRSPLTPHST